MKKLKSSILLIVALIMFMDGCIRDEVLLPPVLISVNKTPVASGEIMVITGNYFDAASLQLLVGDIPVSAAGTPTLTEVSIIVPVVDTPKETMLYAQTKYGKSSGLSITIIPPKPTITKVIPDKAGAGSRIKIAGRFFNGVNGVNFKSPDQANPIAAIYKKLTGDTLEVTVPQGLSPDAADIRVSTSSGETEPPAAFTVLLPPVITSFTPEKAPVGSIVRILGQRFTYIDHARFGDAEAEILSVAPDVLELRVPESAVTDTIHVQSNGGRAKTSKKFEVSPKPQIVSLDKLTGAVGADVTITGLNFQGAFEVKFATTPAQIFSNTGTVLKTKVPPTAGSGKISITTLAGTGVSMDLFEVQGAPLVSSFSPAFGGTGTKIILNGLNLLAVTTARIGAKDLKINSKTDTQMEVEVLAGSVTGKISVISSGNTFETSDNFNIAGTPQITNVNPLSGTIGTVVTLTGINFSGAPDVTFAGGVKAVVSKATPTEVVCQVPVGATTGTINVNGAISPSAFAVSAKPVITAVSPLQGGIDKEVTITGSYFTGATFKFANNLTATKVSPGTDNQVVIKVPAGAVTGRISATNASGTTNSPADFVVISPPTIAGFLPVSGPAGTPIVITGTNLQYNAEVRFYNNVLATIKSVSPTQLMVDVPAGAATGNITVKTDAVTTPVSSSTSFTVVGKPVITSIVPNNGTINEKVTINGTNLGNLVSVSFDGVTTATFVSATPTKIEVRVPATVNGAFSRSINVYVKTSTDNSNNQTFSLLGTPTVAKLSPNNNPASWAFLIEGTNLGNVRKVTLDNKIPTIGTNGVDQKGFNYLTTKVPDDINVASSQNKTLALYYTSDDVGVITTNYQVLSAPPPGVFPPPAIIIPPPLPVNFAQGDLSATWINTYSLSGDGNTATCYNIRGDFQTDNNLVFSSGSFCHFEELLIVRDPNQGTQVETLVRAWTGTWNKGNIQLTAPGGLTLTGYVVLVQVPFTFYMLLTDSDGRQLKIVQSSDFSVQNFATSCN
jgi:large repetitive protein